MPVSINWGTKVINIPQSYLTHISGTLYELDINQFRKDLKSLEDGEEGMPFPDTHKHNTEVSLSGLTYARIVEVLDPYTVEFEDGQYVVSCSGANHNLADVKINNQVSLIINNSAGLVSSGLSDEDKTDIAASVWENNTDAAILLKLVRNKKEIKKDNGVWQLVVYDDDNTTPILNKALKDKDGSNITDLESGTLAQELQTSI